MSTSEGTTAKAKSKSPRSDEAKATIAAKDDKSPRTDKALKQTSTEAPSLLQNTNKDGKKVRGKDKEKHREKLKDKEKEKEGSKPSKVPHEWHSSRDKEKDSDTTHQEGDKGEIKEKMWTSSSPRSNTTTEGSLTGPSSTSSSTPSVHSTSQGHGGEKDDTESSDLNWQEAMDILEGQVHDSTEDGDEGDDLLLVAKREVKRIRESRERQSSIDSDQDDVQISSDEEDSRGERKLHVPSESSGKTAAWEQLLSGMEKKAEQSSIELEWERTLDRSERVASEKSREQEWEASLQRAETLAAASSKEDDWDRFLQKIERTALENTTQSEWEQLLDFTEQVAAKESIVHDWEVTLDEIEKKAKVNTDVHVWEDSLLSAEERALKHSQWEDSLLSAEDRALRESQKELPEIGNPKWAVSLNVYDVVVDGVPLTTLNDRALRIGFGIFYSGVVYGGREYSYSQSAGIYNYRPKGHRNAVHRTTIDLGHSRGQPIEEIIEMIKSVGFIPSNYHVIKKNCNNFSVEMSRLLSGQVPPNWLNRMVRACRFLDVFLPQATFRSNLLTKSSKASESDSISITDIKEIKPDPDERKALAEWESALTKMGKKVERVDLQKPSPTSEFDSSEVALESLKSEIEGSHHDYSHRPHHRRHSHAKKKTIAVAMVNSKDDPHSAEKPSAQKEAKETDASNPKKPLEKPAKLEKGLSKVILDRRLSELMDKLTELNTKEQKLIRQSSSVSGQSDSSTKVKTTDTATSSATD